MLINCVAYQDGKRLGEIEPGEIHNYLAKPGCFVWVALLERDPKVLEQMQEQFGLHELSVEDAQNGHQRPKIEDYGDSLFVVLHLLEAESVLLHADLTADNILVHDGGLSGFIDFADAFVGPWTYELAATSCFVTPGDRRSQRALLAGRGAAATPELLGTLRSWAVLHRYGHVARMMRDAGHASLAGWLESLWLP